MSFVTRRRTLRLIRLRYAIIHTAAAAARNTNYTPIILHRPSLCLSIIDMMRASTSLELDGCMSF